MYKDTNIRSIAKGISWRLFATSITVVVVYFFFGRLDLALYAGAIETVAKVFVYWCHERAWMKIRWGRKKIAPFNLWLTGLPQSGKSTIADLVYKKLQKTELPIERLDSKDIRDLIPDIGYTKDERNRHLGRIGHLVATLQKNGVSAICSFVSPYEKSRLKIAQMSENMVLVYIKADLSTCKQRDYKGVYEKAECGEIKNFTGISDAYEEPKNPHMVLDTDELSANECAAAIVNHLKTKKYI